MGGRSHRPPVNREERIGPTAETALKLNPDPLLGLSPELQNAAAYLTFAWGVLTAALDSRSNQLSPRTSKTFREWTAKECKAVERLKQWRNEMRRRKLPSNPVIAVAVDRQPPWRVDQRYRLAQGKTAELVVEGLHIFARIVKL